MVDLATGRAASGAKLRISEKERENLIQQGCRVLKEHVADITPSWFKPGSKEAVDRRLLSVLANGKPISVLYYRTKEEVSGKRYTSFHHANIADILTTSHYAKRYGQTPARWLFSWMLKSLGKNAILVSVNPTPHGRSFAQRLEKEGVLQQIATGYRNEFVPTGKKMPRLKIRRKIRRIR